MFFIYRFWTDEINRAVDHLPVLKKVWRSRRLVVPAGSTLSHDLILAFWIDYILQLFIEIAQYFVGSLVIA